MGADSVIAFHIHSFRGPTMFLSHNRPITRKEHRLLGHSAKLCITYKGFLNGICASVP